MTFPYGGGVLADPWSDGELVNAAALKSRTTDKLNALADALLVKTARVACQFTTTAAVMASGGTVYPIPFNTITASVGGTFSIASATIDGIGPANTLVLPTTGVWFIRMVSTWNFVTGSADRAYVELVSKSGIQFLMDRKNMPYGENTFVTQGTCEVTAISGGSQDNRISLRGLHQKAAPSSSTVNAGSGYAVKISD